MNQSNPYFTLKQSGKQVDNEYEINISLALPEIRISNSNYSNFYADIQRMLTDKPWLVVYQKDKQHSLASQQKMSEATSNKPMEVSLDQIKRLLDTGDFEAALDNAQKYTKTKSKNG